MMKRCPKCKRLLSSDCYFKNKSRSNGLDWLCKECYAKYFQENKEKIDKKYKKWYQKNKTKMIEYGKKYRKENKERISEQGKQYRKKNKLQIAKYRARYRKENKEATKKSRMEWCQKNKEYHTKYKKENRKRRNELDRLKNKEDLKFRLNKHIKSAIRKSLIIRNISKNGRRWESLVGYTLNDLIFHLEKLFQDGMTWDNRGHWHIDHIKPKSLFNFKDVNDPEFKKCWALNNLQPLWAEDNLKKHNKYIEAFKGNLKLPKELPIPNKEADIRR